MESTEKEKSGRGGISNIYYGNVQKVINLKLARGQHLSVVNGKVIVENDFSGEIKGMKLAHADVAVGVAERGSNVFHHKGERHYGRK